MVNLAELIEHAAVGETIIGAVIGVHDDDKFASGGDLPFNAAPLNQVLAWEVARPFLDYDYDNGYGGADCHPVYAWTLTRVIFIGEYDGATGASWVPRHPTDVEPEFSGGTEW